MPFAIVLREALLPERLQLRQLDVLAHITTLTDLGGSCPCLKEFGVVVALQSVAVALGPVGLHDLRHLGRMVTLGALRDVALRLLVEAHHLLLLVS